MHLIPHASTAIADRSTAGVHRITYDREGGWVRWGRPRGRITRARSARPRMMRTRVPRACALLWGTVRPVTSRVKPTYEPS